MKYILIIVLATILIISIYYFRKKNTKNKNNIIPKNKITADNDDSSNKEIAIKIEELPIEAIKNYESLHEITDSKVLARINNLVPGLMQAGNTANNAIQANSKVLYQAIIPPNATLSESRTMHNAARGIYHGKNGIKGHANLVAVNESGKAVANTVSTGIGVTSMIVGQYYMTQINKELAKINDEISKISEFQDNEYRGKILALGIQVKRISAFQAEIIENKQLREADIDKLNSLEQSCTELLGQANFAITKNIKEKKLDYKQYDKKLEEIHTWHTYQKILLELLYKITELKSLLYLGAMSKEQLNDVLTTYTKQVMDVHKLLIEWHQEITKKLGIDTEAARRKRKGLDGAIHWIPGLFKDDFNFCAISEETKTRIEEQISNYTVKSQIKDEELFNKNVKVISKDGKIYYLPEC